MFSVRCATAFYVSLYRDILAFTSSFQIGLFKATMPAVSRHTIVTDWRVCIWPCCLFALGKPTIPLSRAVTDVLQLKYLRLKRSRVFCVWNNRSTVFSLVFCYAKCDFRFASKETPPKWRLMKKGHPVIDTRVFHITYMIFSRLLSRRLRESAHALKVNCFLLRKGQ